ncbi:MAG: cobalamin biosynthesis protein, partial [Pseudomonadota bacterium]|nr:cobalamin biosynthesis protein [Pseudomonadota bacterium]
MFDPLPLLALTGAAIATRCGILLVAMALDWLVGEPQALWQRAPHPVVIFGRGIGFFDRLWN